MNINEHIDHFVENEKKIEATPFLTTRIMSKVEKVEQATSETTTKFQKLAFVASIALVAVIGINIGKVYTVKNGEEISLNVDDMKMENLSIYNFNDYAD